MRDRRLISAERRRVDAHADRRVARRAAKQWGVLTSDELRECGLGHSAILRRAARGWLHRLYTGVYAVGHPNPSWEGLLLAAVKACGPGAILSHICAAMLWGFIERDEDRYPDVTVIGAGTRVQPRIRVHRTAEFADRDRRRLQGIPLTSPARTLLDIAATLDGAPLRSAVRRAQGTKRVNVREICEVIGRLGPRKGSRRLATVVAEGPAPTRTVLEDVVLDLILNGGLAHPDVNKPLILSGRRVIPDFRWPEQRLIVEADGAAWHAGKVAREDDAERQALLEAHGQRVLRVTWEQAIALPTQTLARLRSAGAPSDDERRLIAGMRR
jgi:predicted transcriptional regulator of viral defense system